jgi:peptide deformylase
MNTQNDITDIDEDKIVLYDTKKLTTVEEKEVKTFPLAPPTEENFSQVAPEFDFANPPVDPNEFASTMVESLKKYKGLGLSAIQCGFNYRVFVMGSEENYVAYFNPKIISSEGEAHMKENCVSFPLLTLAITRPAKIKVEYQDFTGQVRQAEYHGLTARVFQHELDHLNGIVYTTRCKPLALKSGMKKVEKMYKKYFNPKFMKQQIQNVNQKTNP